MKDFKDLRTADLALAPKLGRPSSGNALSNSEKQKAYRERKAGKAVLLSDSERATVFAALSYFAEYGSSGHTHVEITKLMVKFSPSF